MFTSVAVRVAVVPVMRRRRNDSRTPLARCSEDAGVPELVHFEVYGRCRFELGIRVIAAS
jgi:hypothetical protein